MLLIQEKKMQNIVQKERSKQGKRNRVAGQRFEARVRKDLESKGWIVARWTNNVGDYPENNINLPPEERGDRKLIPAKSNRFNMRTTGFPDFIAFKDRCEGLRQSFECWEKGLTSKELLYEVIGVESKGGDEKHKYLDKEEKEKCKWLLNNNVFSKILIARKGKKRGEIIYE